MNSPNSSGKATNDRSDYFSSIDEALLLLRFSALALWQWKSYTVQGEAHAPCYFRMLERRTLDEALAVADAIDRHGDVVDGEPSLFPVPTGPVK